MTRAPRWALGATAALLAALPAAGAEPLVLSLSRASSQLQGLTDTQLYRTFASQLTAELQQLEPQGRLGSGSPLGVELRAAPISAGQAKRPGATVRFTLTLTAEGERPRSLYFEQKARGIGLLGARVLAKATVEAALALRRGAAPQRPISLDAPPAAEEPLMRASRTATAPKIDGRIDDAQWQQAPAFTRFVENLPDTGATPTQTTEVRLLYDDHALYVGIICFDTQPELIDRQLGQRDTFPPSDLVELAIDSALDRRTAYAFSINAAGTLTDGLVYADINTTETFDAVWEGEAADRPDGWSAELEIPLSILRFPAAAEQRWGIHVRRTVSRTHQVFESRLIPPADNAFVSQFGLLGGVTALAPAHSLEVVPYLAARVGWQALQLEPSLDLGVDLRTSLLSDLTLNLTVNPDFGQVEADELVLNLTNFELQFPEKRPFFNQGLELFAPVGSEYGSTHQLFYSRRIGLEAPILAAAKLTGTLVSGLQVGVLDAVVMGAADPSKARLAEGDPGASEGAQTDAPDRRVMFHPSRPLHLGLNSQLPAERPTPMNFLAAVVRADATAAFSLGATFASATPLAARCGPADFATPAAYLAADCRSSGGEVLSLDWNLRSEGRDWVFLGALDASRREGGPLTEVLADGTRMHPSDLGHGGWFKAGKYGGEGLRFSLDGDWASQRLDLNPTGFLSTQNEGRLSGSVALYYTQGLGLLRELQVGLSASTAWSTDGRWTPRGNTFGLDASVTLPSYWHLSLNGTFEMPQFDLREIYGAGIPFERRMTGIAYLSARSDPNRAVVVEARATGSYAPAGPVPAQLGWGAGGTLVVRPHSRIETRLEGSWANAPNGARWVSALPDADALDPSRAHQLFGQQDSETLSVTLRQSVALTPRLTLTAYGQLFLAYARYPRFFSAGAAEGERIELEQLQPTTVAANHDFREASLAFSAVLRWEYRLGSSLFLVYSHSSSEPRLAPTEAPAANLSPVRLWGGPSSDAVSLKWTLWLGT